LRNSERGRGTKKGRKKVRSRTSRWDGIRRKADKGGKNLAGGKQGKRKGKKRISFKIKDVSDLASIEKIQRFTRRGETLSKNVEGKNDSREAREAGYEEKVRKLNYEM